jgi:DNA (cytosine-5)-methyltransferase 1
MTVGSLFSGIGGLDLGLERAGMRVIWQSEIDPYASAVLHKHWPEVPNLGDITKIDYAGIERPDLVCAGFPCQDVSVAGKRAGIDGARTGLWREVVRCLREVGPRLVLLENVPGLFSLGFGRVLGDLAESGFDAEWDCIPAAAVGAPHRRYRVFVVAYSSGVLWTAIGGCEPDRVLPALLADPEDTLWRAERAEPIGSCRPARDEPGGGSPDVADSLGERLQTGLGGGGHGVQVLAASHDGAETQGGRDGALGDWWRTEPDVGRVAHGIPRWVDGLDLDPCLRVIYRYANSTQASASEVVRMVRETYGETEIFQWKARSPVHVCSPSLLLPFLLRIKTVVEQEYAPQKSKEATRRPMRSMSDEEVPSSSSPGSGLQQQCHEQHPDTLQELSRFLALYCQEAWKRAGGSHAANRVSRLRCLGNAVVPQVAEWIGRRIMEATTCGT